MDAVLCRVHLDLRGVRAAGDAYTGQTTITFAPRDGAHDAPESSLTGAATEGAVEGAADCVRCAESVGWAPVEGALMAFADRSAVSISSASVAHGKHVVKVTAIEPVSSSAPGASAELLAFRLATPVRVGPGGSCDLVIRFSGAASRGAPIGLYHIRQHDIITTHFEVTHARRAFPCVDAPSLRVPLALAVQVRPEMGGFVLSNAPVAEAKRTDTKGGVSVRFATTCAAIPAYTYALFAAACPMTSIRGEARQADGSLVAVAVHAPRSTKFPVAHALAVLRAAVASLGDFFAAPLPHTKLDCVVVPVMPIAGMENDGLIFLNEEIGGGAAAGKGGAATAKGGPALVTQILVHEVAHHWVGNLVGLPFAAKEGLCQVIEHNAEHFASGAPVRKPPAQAQAQAQAQAAAVAAAKGSAPRCGKRRQDVEVARGAELTGLTYQHAFNSMMGFVAAVGWSALQDRLCTLVATRAGCFVTQAEFDALFV